MLTILGSIVNIIWEEDLCDLLSEHENLHIDNEWNIHMNSIT